MRPMIQVMPQYIVDENGKKTGVILDIVTFKKLLAEIEDAYFGSLAQMTLEKEKEYLSHQQVKKLT